jgi:hypothetical protein
MLGWKLFGFWLSDIGRYFTFFSAVALHMDVKAKECSIFHSGFLPVERHAC